MFKVTLLGSDKVKTGPRMTSLRAAMLLAWGIGGEGLSPAILSCVLQNAWRPFGMLFPGVGISLTLLGEDQGYPGLPIVHRTARSHLPHQRISPKCQPRQRCSLPVKRLMLIITSQYPFALHKTVLVYIEGLFLFHLLLWPHLQAATEQFRSSHSQVKLSMKERTRETPLGFAAPFQVQVHGCQKETH